MSHIKPSELLADLAQGYETGDTTAIERQSDFCLNRIRQNRQDPRRSCNDPDKTSSEFVVGWPSEIAALLFVARAKMYVIHQTVLSTT
jgi:hypothetical protein